MMTTLATILFTAMMATALVSLAWDLTRPLFDPDANDVDTLARAEAARIAALPRVRQPLRVIGARAAAPQPARVRRSLPELAAAA